MGRVRREVGPPRGHQIGTRVDEQLLAKLVGSAKRNGYSINTDVVERLNESFRREELEELLRRVIKQELRKRK
jgi:hypothetical protein